MKFLNFLLFLWVIFNTPGSGYRSTDLIESGSETLPFWLQYFNLQDPMKLIFFLLFAHSQMFDAF
jgi:hypothetical protein